MPTSSSAVPGQIRIVPGSFSRSMIFFTAIAAVMFTAWPELWPSPCPGAPSIIGAWYATPGFCDACGMPSMSEPSAMTGFPDPHVAMNAVGNAGNAFLHREAVLLQHVDQIAVGLDLLEAQLGKAEDGIDHLLGEDAHRLDALERLGLQALRARVIWQRRRGEAAARQTSRGRLTAAGPGARRSATGSPRELE